jgi:hypothetical protein
LNSPSPSPEPEAGAADLLDLPLRGDRADFALPLATETPTPAARLSPSGPRVVPPSGRIVAAASDAALVVLVVSAALLLAGAHGRPSPAGALWAAAFGLYLSFFAIVTPLVLFGRTVGMALSGLAATPAAAGLRGLELREASRRWLGTVLTGLSLGLAVLVTRRHREAPTPADALSGRSLIRTDEDRAPGDERLPLP